MAKAKIKIVDVTAYTPTQIENYFNTNLYEQGWEIVQVIVIGTNKYILAKRAE
jgi:hypothetical protein